MWKRGHERFSTWLHTAPICICIKIKGLEQMQAISKRFRLNPLPATTNYDYYWDKWVQFGNGKELKIMSRNWLYISSVDITSIHLSPAKSNFIESPFILPAVQFMLHGVPHPQKLRRISLCLLPSLLTGEELRSTMMGRNFRWRVM